MTTCLARFDRANPKAVEWARKKSAALVTNIGKGSRKAIRQAVRQGIEFGRTPRETARTLRTVVGLTERDSGAVFNLEARLRAAGPGEVVDAGSLGKIKIPRQGASDAFIDRQTQRYSNKLLRRRAETIARTETMRAANEGTRQLWSQAVERGELPQNVKRVWIATIDSRVRQSHLLAHGQVKALDEDFNVSDGSSEPGEAVNCRCTMGIASLDDIKNQTHVGCRPTSLLRAAEGFEFRALGTCEPRTSVARCDWDEVLDAQDFISGRSPLRREIDVHDENVRRKMKASIVERLADRLETPVFPQSSAASWVNNMLSTWAGGAASTQRGVASQIVAHRVLTNDLNIPMPNTRLDHFRQNNALVQKELREHGEKMAMFHYAQYAETQEMIRNMPWSSRPGAKRSHLTLFRGVQYGVEDVIPGTGGASVKHIPLDDRMAELGKLVSRGEGYGTVRMQPLNSFTSDPMTAVNFAQYRPGSVVHAVRVPVEHIVGSARSGLGCLNEFEFIVAGGEYEGLSTFHYNAGTFAWINRIQEWLKTGVAPAVPAGRYP